MCRVLLAGLLWLAPATVGRTISAASPPPQHVTRTELVHTRQINTDLNVYVVVVISIVNITHILVTPTTDMTEASDV